MKFSLWKNSRITKTENNVSEHRFVSAEEALLDDMEKENANRAETQKYRKSRHATSSESEIGSTSAEDDSRLASINQALENVPKLLLQTFLHGTDDELRIVKQQFAPAKSDALDALLIVYGRRLVTLAARNWLQIESDKTI